MRYTLADVVELRLTSAGHNRWRYFIVDAVMKNGTITRQPAVNTVAQAKRRQREWFPNATVTLAP